MLVVFKTTTEEMIEGDVRGKLAWDSPGDLRNSRSCLMSPVNECIPIDDGRFKCCASLTGPLPLNYWNFRKLHKEFRIQFR